MFGENSILRSWFLQLVVTVVLITSLNVSALPPSWWSEPDTGGRTVLNPAAVNPDNRGLANLGQAKFMAKRAIEALRVHAAVVANQIESDLVGSGKIIPNWAVPAPGTESAENQYAPLRVGQLKAIAAPFYRRLNAHAPAWLNSQLLANMTKDPLDSSNYFPWTVIPADDDNSAIATIGQLKAVFSLHFATITNQPPTINNSSMPRLQVAGKLLVKVTKPDGTPVSGTDLQFTRVSGNGGFPGGVAHASRTTNASGEVSVADYLSPEDDVIRVSLQTAQGSQTVWLPANVAAPEFTQRSGSGGWDYPSPLFSIEGGREPVVKMPSLDPPGGGGLVKAFHENYFVYTSEETITPAYITLNDTKIYYERSTSEQSFVAATQTLKKQSYSYDWEGKRKGPYDEFPGWLSTAELDGSVWRSDISVTSVSTEMKLSAKFPLVSTRVDTELGYIWYQGQTSVSSYTSNGVARTRQSITLSSNETVIKADPSYANLIVGSGVIKPFVGPLIHCGPNLPEYDTSISWNELADNVVMIDSEEAKYLTAELFARTASIYVPSAGRSPETGCWKISSSEPDILVNFIEKENIQLMHNEEPTEDSDESVMRGEYFKGFKIKCASGSAEKSTITLSFEYAGQTVVQKEFDVVVRGSSEDENPSFSYGENPLSVTMPVEESSGPKYRKIALNGRPISDEKPQNDSESDEEDEETYVDALSRELRHSTTDIYVPVPGSDLALTVRRNASSEIWNPTSGLLPREDPTLSFGPAWRSNLGANIKIIEQVERPLGHATTAPLPGSLTTLVAEVPMNVRKMRGLSQEDPNYAFVTDENGSSYRFLIGYTLAQPGIPSTRFFVPAPTSVNERDSYEMSLDLVGDDLVFKKRHGNTLVFKDCIRFYLDRVRMTTGSLGSGGDLAPDTPESGFLNPNKNGTRGARGSSQLQDFRYLRLASVTDRLGNCLDYTYGGREDITPVKIEVRGRPELAMHIKSTNGRVQSVFDPMGNETKYDYLTSSGTLTQVMDGLTPIAKYEYRRWYEADPKEDITLADGTSLLSWAQTTTGPVQYAETTQHLDLSSITDADSNKVAFIYTPDKSHIVKATSRFAGPVAGVLSDLGESQQTYPEAGHPPDVSQILLPGGDIVKIGNSQDIPPAPGNTGTILSADVKHTTVLDAQNHRRTYSWPESYSVQVNQFELGYKHRQPIGPVVGLRHLSPAEKSSTVSVNETGSKARYTYFTKMKVNHDSEGSETFTFDHLAGCALKSVKDFSGNMIHFGYGESNGPGSPTIPLGSDRGGIMPLYSSKPTSQTDALLRTKKFVYGHMGMLDKTHDHNNHVTDYGVDSNGRTTREKISLPGTTQSPLEKIFSDTEIIHHPTYPGFVSRRTVKNEGEFVSSSDPGWVAPLTQLYEPDGQRRVGRQATDMNGNNTIDAGDLITTFTYDRNGNKLSETNPSGLTTWFHYDPRNRLVGVTYPDGTEKKTIYDVRGKKILEYDEKGIASGFVYDGRGRLTKTIRDMNGNLASTPSGLTGVNPGVDLITEMTYNKVDSVTHVKDARGYISVTDYDHLQRPTRKITPGPTWPSESIPTDFPTNQVTRFFYNGENTGASSFDVSGFKPTTIVDPRGYTSKFIYDELYRLKESRVQYSLNPVRFAQTTNEYDPVSGSISDVHEKRQPTLEDGTSIAGTWGAERHTQTIYDELYRAKKVETLDTDGNSEATTGYTATGLVKNTTRKLTSTLTAVTDMEYDRAGRLTKTIAPAVPLDGTATMVRPATSTVYSPSGSVIETVDARAQTTRFVHDARERLIQTISPPVYDAESQQNNRLSITTNIHDKVGNVVSVINPRGYSTVTTYDAANRVTEVAAPTYLDPLTQLEVTPVTLSEYDLAGNPIKVTDANGSVTINTYDPLSRVASTKTNPLVPATTSAHAGDQIVSFVWDKVGNKTKVTDGLNQVTSFEYDGKNRLTATIWDSDDITRRKVEATEYDSLVSTATVDARANRTEYSYNARLLLKGSTCAQIADDNESRTYDNGGRLLTVKRTAVNDPRNVSYVYDNLDRVTQETSAGSSHDYGYDSGANRTLVQYQTGRKLITAYDNQSRVTTITESATGVAGTRQTGYQYDLAGNVLTRSQANNTKETSSYNSIGRRTSQSTMNGTTPISNFLYSYDRVGNVLNIGEIYGSTTIPDRKVTNVYDRQNRLLTEKADTLNSAQAVTKSVLTTYIYNKADSRTSKYVQETQGSTQISNVTETSVYGDAVNGKNSNQLHSHTKSGQTTTYTYDASGNRAGKSVGGVLKESYGWDSRNRLVSLTQASPAKTYSYGYDYRARRVIRNESAAAGENTTVSFSGGTSAFEKVGSTLKVEYVRGSDYGGGIGGIMYTVRSGVNSFNAYNSRGDVVAKTTAAGTVSWQATYESFGTRTTETGTNPDRQKANTKEEDPTGLLNEGFRYRDLVTGSFISRDPLGFVDGPNVYTYVRQNPWSAFDPKGLSVKQLLNVGAALMRNKKFANKSITTKMLREGGSKVAQETFDKVAKKFGPDFAVKYDEEGRIFFPKEAVGGTISEPFGPGDTQKAWKQYENKMITEHGEKAGKELADSARDNFEMHHTNENGVFEMVDKDVHKAYAHTGGNALSKEEQMVMGAADAVIPNFKEALEKDKGAAAIAGALAVDTAVALEPTGLAQETIMETKKAADVVEKKIEKHDNTLNKMLDEMNDL